MQSITTIGLDIAKSVFQVHGVDAAGRVVVRRQLRRRQVLAFFQKLPPCLVGIEACASSHHWSRELQALGHTVRLMPAAYVKPYVKRHKNDATDAEAICEAVIRPSMRFVSTKTTEQQACLMLHRARHLLIRQQTAVINSIRAYLAEFGIIEGSDVLDQPEAGTKAALTVAPFPRWCRVRQIRTLTRCNRTLSKRNGAPRRNRTADPIITNDVLYQLSYRGTRAGLRERPGPCKLPFQAPRIGPMIPPAKGFQRFQGEKTHGEGGISGSGRDGLSDGGASRRQGP
jgi:hypothetical protein